MNSANYTPKLGDPAVKSAPISGGDQLRTEPPTRTAKAWRRALDNHVTCGMFSVIDINTYGVLVRCGQAENTPVEPDPDNAGEGTSTIVAPLVLSSDGGSAVF